VLSSVGTSASRFEVRCDGCLEPSPIFEGPREHAEAQIILLGWELRAQTTWCVPCQRRAREVKLHDRRGRRRR